MKKFNQLCVIHGLTLEGSNPKEFTDFIKNNLNTRIKFAEEVKTVIDSDEVGEKLSDIFFYVHDDDIEKFARPRFGLGVRWWEDVVKYNDNRDRYTQETLDKYPTNW